MLAGLPKKDKVNVAHTGLRGLGLSGHFTCTWLYLLVMLWNALKGNV